MRLRYVPKLFKGSSYCSVSKQCMCQIVISIHEKIASEKGNRVLLRYWQVVKQVITNEWSVFLIYFLLQLLHVQHGTLSKFNILSHSLITTISKSEYSMLNIAHHHSKRNNNTIG